MRLADTEILAGLVYPSIYIRDVILDYLEDGERVDPATARSVIAAIEQYGWQDAFLFPHRLASFEVDETVAEWVMAQLDRDDQGAPSQNMRRHLAEMMAWAPVEVLAPRRERLLREEEALQKPSFWAPTETRSYAERIDLRLKCWARSPDECWSDLEQHCRAVAHVEEFADADIQYAEMLVERIASAGHEFAGRAMEILDCKPRSRGTYLDWLVGLMIVLVGRLRLEDAIELIYRHFAVDWDWYNEEISRALVRIGTPAVGELVSQRYFRRREHVRIYSQGILESIHHDRSVDWILPLVAEEDDDGFRGQLGVALASHFDERGIEPALEIYLEDPDDPERFAIIERLFAHARLAGFELPELPQWERKIERSWAGFDRNRDMLMPLLRRYLQSDDGQDELNWDEGHPPRKRLPSDGMISPDQLGSDFAPQTIVRTEARVGRNEPCPCGSGKKYKKCCWRMEDG